MVSSSLTLSCVVHVGRAGDVDGQGKLLSRCGRGVPREAWREMGLNSQPVGGKPVSRKAETAACCLLPRTTVFCRPRRGKSTTRVDFISYTRTSCAATKARCATSARSQFIKMPEGNVAAAQQPARQEEQGVGRAQQRIGSLAGKADSYVRCSLRSSQRSSRRSPCGWPCSSS